MAGGAGELPKWQNPQFGGDNPSFVLADPIGWRKWRQPAKMADRGRKLPKWQALANVVPQKYFFALIFFACNCRYQMYDDGKERKEVDND